MPDVISRNSAAMPRREFLRNGLGAAVAGSLLAGATQPVAAIEPIARTGKPYLKLSMAAYSYRQFLEGDKPTMTLDDFVAKCAEFNLDGTELTSYWFPQQITAEYLNHLKQLTFRLGLDISGTAIRNDFCVPMGPERDKWLAHTRQWIDYAAAMGAPVIRIFAGNVPAGSSEAEAVDRCVEGIQKSLEYAAQKGVFLALENHGGITSTPDQLLAIVKRIESPWFGLNLDSGNFHTADPYGDLARIAPYAINAQIKTDIAPNNQKQEADLERIVKILQDAGYRGYLVLEYEGAADPITAIPKALDRLRQIV
ncbi:MAG TPA: sugar phosphate isomerase/epimerase family protein, partial [Planctomycetaceae bacterium]|nr:sugar phosphate isomerase/epimerase family protein [Planctomycetaceae bacterium]